jgi:hypothetical protein
MANATKPATAAMMATANRRCVEWLPEGMVGRRVMIGSSLRRVLK